MSPSKGMVHVVDDDGSFRSATARLLSVAGYSVKSYASAGEFLLAERAGDSPACLLLDLSMPGPSGLELHEALSRKGDRVPVIYISGRGDVPTTVRAMKAGAEDFLTKPVDRCTLFGAIDAALKKAAERKAEKQRDADLAARLATLTPREREIFQLVVAGLLNKQIADRLGMAERTVKAHRARVMAKMRAESLAELVALAAELHIRPSRT